MKVLAVGGLIATLGSLQVRAECAAPQAPSHLPDGATASREDMVSAMQAIHEYEAAVKTFQTCAEGTSNSFDRKAASLALDRLVGIADKFNFELNAFKKKSAQ